MDKIRNNVGLEEECEIDLQIKSETMLAQKKNVKAIYR